MINPFNRLKNLISPHGHAVSGADSNHRREQLPMQPAPPDESVISKEQGDALLRQGNLENAKACYQHAIALDPDYAKAYSNLGFIFREQGDYREAERCLKYALSIDPNIADTHYMLGTIFQNQRKLEDAAYHFRNALELDPYLEFAYRDLCYVLFQQGNIDQARDVIAKGIAHYPDTASFYYYLGNLYAHTKEFDRAAACYRAALSIQPAYAGAHFNLGIALQGQGNLSDAIASYQNAIAHNPDFAEAHYNLGVVFLKEHRPHSEAEACFRRALEINPDFADAHYELGNVLRELDRLEEAEASYRRAIKLSPDHADTHLNLGNVLKGLNRLDEAEASFRRVLLLTPDSAETHSNLGNIQKDLCRLSEAEASYRRALQINPDLAEVYSNLGSALREMGRLAEAEASCRLALKIKPNFIDAHVNLGGILQDMSRSVEAEATYRKALQINPDYADAHSNLGGTLMDMGRLDEAEASFQHAIQIEPDHAIAQSSLLFLYSYQALLDPKNYLVQARKWEHACVPRQDRQAARHRIFQRAPLTGRRLKVGYVSGDFRQHAVSYFIEQLFTHHDRARVDLFSYSNSLMQDAVTDRLHALTEHWINIAGIGDTAVRNLIEEDGIDVLIDLSGHTAGNRLGVFARRAAPVQAYYLGYFASTGLTEMDYWIGDDILTPPETDSHFSEQVWRLPRVWVSYKTIADAPDPDWCPATDGSVWVGSFNNLGKLTPKTLALWAKVLHALPEGRLLLKTKELADGTNRQRILDNMRSNGIPSDRIELQRDTNWVDYMAQYNRLDIALDPVDAHSGGTITCDALWMGVPVIHALGSCATSRFTASMLNAIGHPEWIAHSEAEYIDKVVALSKNVEQRKMLRYSQRDLMARSPLCDAKNLAMNLENAYFEMFNRWLNEKS